MVGRRHASISATLRYGEAYWQSLYLALMLQICISMDMAAVAERDCSEEAGTGTSKNKLVFIMHLAELLSCLLKGLRLGEVHVNLPLLTEGKCRVLDFDLRLGGFPVPGLSIK